MNLHTRLNAIQRERGRRCSACGGALASAAPPRTWRALMEEYSKLPDVEKVAAAARAERMHLLPPALQERAHRLYCQQRGLEYDYRACPYSSPSPPPAPSFPESGPMPALPPRFG